MKKIIYLLFTATFFLATACDKEDDLQCDRTSTNHNILCCKINGEDWTPAGGGPDVISPYRLEYYAYDGFFVMNAGNTTIQTNNVRGAITIVLNNTKMGINSIIDNESLWHFSNPDNSDECRYYDNLADDMDKFVSILEIDTIDYFIKGKFEFSAINACEDTVRITDGYFDLNYFF